MSHGKKQKICWCFVLSIILATGNPVYADTAESESTETVETTESESVETEETETSVDLCLDETEEVKDGLVTENGALYYYDKGVRFCGGYKNIGGIKYYFMADGRAYCGGLLKYTYNGKTYYSYFQKTGDAYRKGYLSTATYAVADENCVVTKCPDGVKRYYYFQSSGIAYTRGFLEFVNTNDKTYYFYFQTNGEGYTKGYLSTHTYAYAGQDAVVTGYTYGDKRCYFFKNNGQAARSVTVEFVAANFKSYCMLIRDNGQGIFINKYGYYNTTNDTDARILKRYCAGCPDGDVMLQIADENSAFYHQNKLGYTASGVSMTIDGCGPTAIANILAGYKSGVTPVQIAEYMYVKGYLYKNEGTTRAGFTNTLKHYGFSVLNYIEAEGSGGTAFNNAFSKFNEYSEYGRNVKMSLLVVPSGKNKLHDKNYWTAGGHYIDIVATRRGTDGKDYYYVIDPGAKRHTGWYTADDLRYYVNVFWIEEYS